MPSRYLTTFRVGEYVDIAADASVHRGMPYEQAGQRARTCQTHLRAHRARAAVPLSRGVPGSGEAAGSGAPRSARGRSGQGGAREAAAGRADAGARRGRGRGRHRAPAAKAVRICVLKEESGGRRCEGVEDVAPILSMEGWRIAAFITTKLASALRAPSVNMPPAGPRPFHGMELRGRSRLWSFPGVTLCSAAGGVLQQNLRFTSTCFCWILRSGAPLCAPARICHVADSWARYGERFRATSSVARDEASARKRSLLKISLLTCHRHVPLGGSAVRGTVSVTGVVVATTPAAASTAGVGGANTGPLPIAPSTSNERGWRRLSTWHGNGSHCPQTLLHSARGDQARLARLAVADYRPTGIRRHQLHRQPPGRGSDHEKRRPGLDGGLSR
eukprot:ctg_210.g162